MYMSKNRDARMLDEVSIWMFKPLRRMEEFVMEKTMSKGPKSINE